MKIAKPFSDKFDPTIRFFIISSIIIAVPLLIFDIVLHEHWDNVVIEAHGLLFDVILFGIILTVYDLRKRKKDNIERLLNELDDNRGWNEKSAMYRNVGIIKRLNKTDAKEINLIGIYLENAFLSNISLIHAKLILANLKQANFSWSNLSKSIFFEANLTQADLTWSNLSEADLTCANLTEADLSAAKLIDADLTGANLTKTILIGADLSNANLQSAILINTKVDSTNFVLENKNIDLKYYVDKTPLKHSTGQTYYEVKIRKEVENIGVEPMTS